VLCRPLPMDELFDEIVDDGGESSSSSDDEPQKTDASAPASAGAPSSAGAAPAAGAEAAGGGGGGSSSGGAVRRLARRRRRRRGPSRGPSPELTRAWCVQAAAGGDGGDGDGDGDEEEPLDPEQTTLVIENMDWVGAVPLSPRLLPSRLLPAKPAASTSNSRFPLPRHSSLRAFVHRKRRRRLCRAAACRASSVRPHLKPPRYWQWTSDRDLREMGSSYGTIVKVQFKEERRTGKSLGCATSPSAAGNQLARLSRTQRITLCASVLPAAELPWSPSKLSAPRGTPKSTSSPGSAFRSQARHSPALA